MPAAQARWSLDVSELARKYVDASSMRPASVCENSEAMRAVNARLISSRSWERDSAFITAARTLKHAAACDCRMGHVRALPTVLLSTADPGLADRACSFLRNAAGPETEPAASAPAFKETDGGRTKPDEFSSPQPTTVSNKTGAGVH